MVYGRKIIQGGEAKPPSGGFQDTTISYPIAFSVKGRVLGMARGMIVNNNENYYITRDATTNFGITSTGTIGTNARAYRYIAAGY